MKIAELVKALSALPQDKEIELYSSFEGARCSISHLSHVMDDDKYLLCWGNVQGENEYFIHDSCPGCRVVNVVEFEEG